MPQQPTPPEQDVFRDIRRRLFGLEKEMEESRDVPSLTKCYYNLLALHSFLKPWWESDMLFKDDRKRIEETIASEVIPLYNKDRKRYADELWFVLLDWLSCLNGVAKRRTIYGTTVVTTQDKIQIPEAFQHPPEER